MTARVKKEKSAGAIIFYRGEADLEFLLLHYGKGHWEFPKGHIEGKETERETLLRELEEETGILDARLVPGFRHEIQYFFTEGKKTISKTAIFYLAESESRDVRLSFEHSEFEWLSFEKALKKLSFPNTRELLRKANAFLAQKSPSNS
ncbi:MAG: NUDIX domain-containing protein [Candidatus Diapherotrites archaeon]|nr:NUDIX domain-containing protein [Candidatus Diapherotrites archaeon]